MQNGTPAIGGDDTSASGAGLNDLGLGQVIVGGGAQLITDLTNIGNLVTPITQNGSQSGIAGPDDQQGSGIGGAFGQFDSTGKPHHHLHNPLDTNDQ